MNCGQQFGQQMAFCNRLLLQVNYGQQDFLNRFITSHLEETNKNIRRKIFRFYGEYGADGGSLPRPKNAPPGHFYPAGRKAPGTGCSNPTLRPLHSLPQKQKAAPRKVLLLAQMVGVEPTRQSPVLKHFELIFEKVIW